MYYFLSIQQGVFFFSCIWSMGACLNSGSREKFSIIFQGLLHKEFPNQIAIDFGLPDHLIMPPLKPYIFTIPEQGSVFDYRYIKEVSLTIIHNYSKMH